MKRNAIQDLINWKSSEERKPMLLKGTRQVGKTWLMKEFGQNHYDNFVYFNFDEEDELKLIFETNKNPHRIIDLLSMISGKKILPVETLIIFDEIQECPEALNTLKYFKEKSNDYVIAAGIDNSAILLKTDYQFKDPLTENYVLQQLHGQFAVEPRYFSDKNSEIDFVLQYGTEIIPMEAKSGEDNSAAHTIYDTQ